jgi:hypothetical protein
MNDDILTLPKEFWLPNETSKSCRRCDKGFTAVSRKHHCRYCGLIFCNNCAKENQRISSITKLERICEDCLALLKSHTDLHKPMKISMVNSFNSDISQSFVQDENILDFIKAIQPSLDLKLESSIQEFSSHLSQKLVHENNLNNSWSESLKKIGLEIVETVCPSVKFREDHMNLNDYIKRFRLRSEKPSCIYFQGSLISKNVAHKKMLKKFDSPRLLFLDNRENQKFSITNMFNVIQEESEVDHLFIKKIEAIQPNVLITTSGLSENVLNDLVKINMTAIINVKIDEFFHLARITRAVVLKSLNECCLIDSFLGLCKKMELKDFGLKHYVCFTDVQDSTLGGSVIISGDQTKKISKVLKELIIGLRNAKLEGIFMFECGSPLVSTALISQYNSEITLKTMQVWKHLKCKELSMSTVKIYTSHDICLGSFLSLMIKMADESCGRCGNHLRDHVSYFFANSRVLKISMYRQKSITENDFFLSTNCLACHQMVPLHYLTTPTWEYSFNKFIWNFFAKSTALSKCGHELFSNSFKFQLGTTQLLFNIKDFSKFDMICNLPYKFNSEFFHEILQESLKITQISSKCVLDHLLEQGKKLAVKVNNDMANCGSEFEKLKTLRERVLKMIEDIYATIKNLFEAQINHFGNFLAVEGLRRQIFLKCIQSRYEIIQIENRKRSPLVKKMSFLTNSNSVLSELFQNKDSFAFDDDLISLISKLSFGILTFPMNHSIYVPVYEGDTGSMIAHAFSSQAYYTQVLDNIGTNFKEFILDKDDSEWNFSVSSFESLELKEDCRRLFCENHSLILTSFFSKQFHSLRMARHINNEQFVLSLSKTITKTCDIGKSSASFKQSHDNRFLIKIIDEKELKMFHSFATQFFHYFFRCSFEKTDSILNFCLGVFKVQLKNLTTGKSRMENVMIFEKIGCGLSPPYLVYDLKGTTNKRRKVKEGEKRTKMDLNFVEDFENLPLPVDENSWDLLKRAVVNDSGFLSRCNVIDYSILLVISLQSKKIALGIIDYLQQYTFDKVLESKYKTVVGSQVPTITHPEAYKQRFCETVLNHYFMKAD